MNQKHAFTMNEHGLYYRLPSGTFIWLSGPFKVMAEAQNADGTVAAVLLTWKDPAGQDHQWVMPRALLARNAVAVRRTLLDGGLFVAANRAARKKLTFYLANARPAPVTRQVSQNVTADALAAFADLIDDAFGPERGLEEAMPEDNNLWDLTTEAWLDKEARYRKALRAAQMEGRTHG